MVVAPRFLIRNLSVKYPDKVLNGRPLSDKEASKQKSPHVKFRHMHIKTSLN